MVKNDTMSSEKDDVICLNVDIKGTIKIYSFYNFYLLLFILYISKFYLFE